MNDAERAEIIRTLSRQAEMAHTLGNLYEHAADTVAGFRTEEEYQAYAEEAFEAQESAKDSEGVEVSL